MTAIKEIAKAIYLAKIKVLGVDYRKCGHLGGMDTALCLMGLKEKLGRKGEWDKWGKAMKGNSDRGGI